MVAKLGDNVCSAVKLQIPPWGRAWADVELTEAVALSGAQTLTVAGATYRMTIVSGGGTDDARARYRLVAGSNGWGTALRANSYQNDAGVAASLVIRDAARECGESVGTLPTTTVGPHFARAVGPASATLNLLAPRAWYVDAAGVTQFGARSAATYSGDGTRTLVDPARGIIDLAVEEIGNLAPGVVVDGVTAGDIEISLDTSRLNVRIYGTTAGSNYSGELANLIKALFPQLPYLCPYEYRVVLAAGNKLHIQPVRPATTGMMDLQFVPVRLAPGVRAEHKLGSLVLVAFADGDPSRPQVITGDHPDSPGWLPTELVIEGTNVLINTVAIDPSGNVVAPAEVSAMGGLTKLSTHLHPTAMGPSGAPTPGT